LVEGVGATVVEVEVEKSFILDQERQWEGEGRGERGEPERSGLLTIIIVIPYHKC